MPPKIKEFQIQDGQVKNIHLVGNISTDKLAEANQILFKNPDGTTPLLPGQVKSIHLNGELAPPIGEGQITNTHLAGGIELSKLADALRIILQNLDGTTPLAPDQVTNDHLAGEISLNKLADALNILLKNPDGTTPLMDGQITNTHLAGDIATSKLSESSRIFLKNIDGSMPVTRSVFAVQTTNASASVSVDLSLNDIHQINTTVASSITFTSPRTASYMIILANNAASAINFTIVNNMFWVNEGAIANKVITLNANQRAILSFLYNGSNFFAGIQWF